MVSRYLYNLTLFSRRTSLRLQVFKFLINLSKINLSWDSKLAQSTLYRARLHSPVDKISVIKKNLLSTQVHYENGVAFLSSPDGPLLVVELEKNSCFLDTQKITSVQVWKSLKERYKLTMSGTLANIRAHAKKYLMCKEKQYTLKGHDQHQVNFEEKSVEAHTKSIWLVDRALVFIAQGHTSKVLSAQLSYDGNGVRATTVQDVIDFEEGWGCISSLCVSGNQLYIAHKEGITAMSIESRVCQVVYQSSDPRCTVVPFQRGALFSDQVTAQIYKIDEGNSVHVFAGKTLKVVKMVLRGNANLSSQWAFVSSLTMSFTSATLSQILLKF